MKKVSTYLPFIMILVLMLVSFATSCDKRNPPPVVPTVPPPPPLGQERHFGTISASPSTIYADNGITFSIVSVAVKDGAAFPVVGQIVRFKTDLGRILTSVATDSTGIARTTFWDGGVPGTANITAIVQNFSADNPDSLISADTTQIAVTIANVPPISEVTLELPSTLNPQPLNVMQAITVRGRARNILGNDVPDNTLLTFSATKGFFIDSEGNTLGDSIVVATLNGRATCTYNAGPIAGTGVLTVRISNASSARDVLINPGRPASIRLRSYVQVGQQLIEADTSSVASPNWIWMRAELKDSYNNVCAITPVKFRTNLGTFLNTVQEITTNSDVQGLAQVRFTPGLQAGAATITALANGDTLTHAIIFNIKSNDIYSIQFTQSGQIDLNVANTGGTETAILKVKLYDINGNLIDTPQNVYFKLANGAPPAGSNLNNSPQGDSVLVISNGGEAQISVNSGTESGVLIIKASCTSMTTGRYVRAMKANIVIHAGPPHTIVPFISGYNTGENMGGGLWRVVAGASIFDTYGNPVDYGTSVWFTMPDLSFDVQIQANTYAGNESANGDSTAGVAYTVLTYSGIYSLEQVKVRATTGGIGGADVYGESFCILPLNQPQLELEIVPGHIDFHGNTNPTPPTATAILNASLFDIQGCAIHKARISLTSTRGFFEYTPGTCEDPNNCNPQDDAHIIVTDWYDQNSLNNNPPYWDVNDNQDGLAQGLIRFYATEIPLGDPMTNTPGSTTVTITARLLGTNTSAQTTENLLRYPT